MATNATSPKITERYRTRMVGLRKRAQAEARRTWSQIDANKISETYQAGMLTLTVATLQREAARLSGAYLKAFTETELGRPVPELLTDARTVGSARNGSELRKTIQSPLIGVKVAIKDGTPPSQALAQGGHELERIVGLATDTAAREALRRGMQDSPYVTGWRRAVQGTCGACLGADKGTDEPPGAHLDIHPNCRCVAEPVIHTGKPDRFRRPTGQDRFNTMTQVAQDAAVGPEAAGLVRDGLIVLNDLRGSSPMATEPDFITQAPLPDAVRRALARTTAQLNDLRKVGGSGPAVATLEHQRQSLLEVLAGTYGQVKAFDPNERRDEHGQWTSGGSAPKLVAAMTSSEDLRALFDPEDPKAALADNLNLDTVTAADVKRARDYVYRRSQDWLAARYPPEVPVWRTGDVKPDRPNPFTLKPGGVGSFGAAEKYTVPRDKILAVSNLFFPGAYVLEQEVLIAPGQAKLAKSFDPHERRDDQGQTTGGSHVEKLLAGDTATLNSTDLRTTAARVAASSLAWREHSGQSMAEAPPDEEVQANFRRQLRGRISADKEARGLAAAAIAENDANPLWRRIIAANLPDHVIVSKPAKDRRLTMLDTSESEGAKRIPGSTVLPEHAAKIIVADAGNQKRPPERVAVMTGYGLAALMRHEYGHSLDDMLRARNPEAHKAILAAIPDPATDLTYYSAQGTDREVIPELLALVTHPDYREQDYPETIQRAGHLLLDAIGAGGGTKAFDPRERRDAQGQWTDTGGGPKFEGDWSGAPKAEQAARQALDALRADYPDLPVKRVVLRQSEDFNQMAGKDNDTIYLSPRFADDEAFAKWEKELGPYVVDGSRAGVIVHETGHMLEQQMAHRDRRAWDALHQYIHAPVTYKVGNKDVTAPRWQAGDLKAASAYASESPFEYIAEAFSDWRVNGEKAKEPSREIGHMIDAVWGHTGTKAYVETQHPRDDHGRWTKVVDVGDDVNRAADLLSQGIPIRLQQPYQVATLIDELARRVEEAKAKGKDAPNYDLCKVTVKNTNLFCAESKGIKRVHMPQLKGTPLPGSRAAKLNGGKSVDLSTEFRKSLESRGVKTHEDIERADHLRATQMELNGAKVAGMTKRMDAGTWKQEEDRLFVSTDNYIVDGHHRWAASVAHDLRDNKPGDIKLPVVRIEMDIIDLLAEANAFAKEWGIPQSAVSNVEGKAATIEAEPRDRLGRWTDGGGAMSVEDFANVFDGFSHGGLTARVRVKDTWPPAGGKIKLTVMDEREFPSGSAIYSFQGDAAHIDLINLQPSVRDRGFATALHTKLFETLRHKGIKRVDLDAVDVGSYAWARAGFHWKFGAAAEQRRMLADARDRGALKSAPPELVTELERKVAAGEFDSEAELAAFGRQHTWIDENGQTMWLGKRIMIRGNWTGERAP